MATELQDIQFAKHFDPKSDTPKLNIALKEIYDAIRKSSNAGVPIGAMFYYTGPVAKIDQGWALVDARVVKRADFPGLFGLWGTTYNTGGEAADEFRFPDATSVKRFIRSSDGTDVGVGGLGATGGSSTHDHTGSTGGNNTVSKNEGTAGAINIPSPASHNHSIGSANHVPGYIVFHPIVKTG